jgi:hypothetical protein
VAINSVPSDDLSKSTIDAKGDLIVGSADNTVTKLTAGANGLYLAADSSTTSGLVWTTVASGGPISARVTSGSAGGTYTITNSFASGVYIVDITGSMNNIVLGSATINSTGLYYTSTTTSSVQFNAFGPWTTRTSSLGTNSIYALTYGNNVYVAGGNNGTLSTSTDAITWTSRSANFGTTIITALTYGNGVYVAGGWIGKISTSTDGITWTSRNSSFNFNHIFALTYNDNLYVAGGENGTITTSTDAIGPLNSDSILSITPTTTITAVL